MTPEQREQARARYFDFMLAGEHYTFKTHGGPFLSFEYVRQFPSLAESIEHAKAVVTQCGGSWEQHSSVGASAWIEDNIKHNGCTILVVCDPTMYEEFLRSEGVMVDLPPIFKEVFKDILKSDGK